MPDFMKASRRPRGKISVFKEMDETPSRFSGNLCPVNLEEQKKRFLQFGIAPKFVLRRSQQQDGKTEEVWQAKNLIRFDYFGEAKAVLDTVRQKYGDGPEYLNFAFGNPINYVQASEVLAEYLRENNAEGEMVIYWTPELTCRYEMSVCILESCVIASSSLDKRTLICTNARATLHLSHSLSISALPLFLCLSLPRSLSYLALPPSLISLSVHPLPLSSLCNLSILLCLPAKYKRGLFSMPVYGGCPIINI